MAEVVIVVPCFNEATRLDTAAFRDYAPKRHRVRVLFVNDGSGDETAQVLDSLCATAPERFRAIHLPSNLGKGEAVRSGLLAALREQPAYVGYWDADLATPLDAIEELCDVLCARPKVEMVFGARVKLLGRTIERSRARHYAGRVFATAAANVLRLAVYDTQCGAKLLRVTPGLPALLDEPFLARWIFDVELIARLIRARSGTDATPVAEAIYEYPLLTWNGLNTGRLHLRDYPIAALALARIYWRYLRT